MMELVKLVGTEKQVAWANDIRAKALRLDDVRRNYRFIADENRASWWIDHRYDLDDAIIRAARKAKLQVAAGYTKTQIFRRAHQLAKAMKSQYPDTDYHANFSTALKELYAVIRYARRELVAA